MQLVALLMAAPRMGDGGSVRFGLAVDSNYGQVCRCLACDPNPAAGLPLRILYRKSR